MPRPAGMVERSLTEEEQKRVLVKLKTLVPLTFTAACADLANLTKLFGGAASVTSTVSRDFLVDSQEALYCVMAVRVCDGVAPYACDLCLLPGTFRKTFKSCTRCWRWRPRF